MTEQRRPAATPKRTVRGVVESVAALLIGDENPSGAIYGLVVIGTLMAAESGRHESYLDTLLSALLGALLYWLAHGYASALGTRLGGRERLTVGVLARALAHDLALIRGAAVPLVALALAALVGASQETAVTIAVWTVAVSLTVFELLAGVRAGASRGELVLETSVGAAMGLAVLLLRIILH